MLIINCLLFLIISISNLLIRFRSLHLTVKIKTILVFIIYSVYLLWAVQIYGLSGFIFVFINLINSPFRQGKGNKIFIAILLYTCNILSAPHSIFYVCFVVNLMFINTKVDLNLLFLNFFGFTSIVNGVSKKASNFFFGKELGTIGATGAFLYGADQVSRQQKIDTLDAKISSKQEEMKDFQFRSGSSSYEDLSTEDKLIYDSKYNTLQELFRQKTDTVGTVQEQLHSAADILKDLF